MVYTPFEQYFKDCAERENKRYLFESYENIKEQVISRTESNRTRTFWYDYRLRNHPERIINIIYQVISPFLEKKKLTLSADEQYALLCSAYLHDLVKFFPSLRIDNLPEKESLKIYQIKEIEKFHDFDIFRILMFYTNPGFYSEGNPALEKELFDLFSVYQSCQFFQHLGNAEERRILIESIAIISGFHKSLTIKTESIMQDRMEKFLTCDNNRDPEDKVGEIRKDWGKTFGKLEYICDCIHKKNIKIDLLAALIKLGDCFDISEERVNKDMIKDVELRISKRDDWNVLAKWYQFHIVKKIEVKPINDNVDIIIEYCIPPALNKDDIKKITFFRKLAEKDFNDLTYLKVIEYYLYYPNTLKLELSYFTTFILNKYEYRSNEPVKSSPTISAKYKVSHENIGNIVEGVLKYIDKSLEEEEKEYKNKKKLVLNNEKTTVNLEIDDVQSAELIAETENGKLNIYKKKNDKSESEPIKSFSIFPGYDDSPKIAFPVSKEVLFILSFFSRYPSEPFSIEEIGKKTGLDPARIQNACNNLAEYKYLEKDKEDKFKMKEGEQREELKQIIEEYQRNPYNLKIKAWEIKKFGKPLPLENITRGDVTSTGIHGLDMILSDKGDPSTGGIKADQCILIKGAPGTGKTTLAVQFLLNKEGLNCLYLTFEEDLKQLKDNFKDFGFDLNRINFVTFSGLLSRKNSQGDLSIRIFEFLTEKIDENNPDILVIDSITRFREFTKPKDVRMALSDFMSILKIRHITSFFIGEEVKGYNFEDYLVDGIIKLGYQEGKRSIEILKLRGQDFAPGVHSYKILDKKKIGELEDYKIKPGINVFPNLNTYLKEKSTENINKNPLPISSGTRGLDDLLPVDELRSGFIEGEFILVAGSPGSGKTLIGLQFLKEGEDKKEKSLWISFEGEQDELIKSIGDIEPLKGIEKKEYFKFRYFAPFNINLDEFVYIINRHLECGVKRIVIDSISDLIAVFEDRLRFKNFVNSFLQILHNHGATTMLLYRIPNFFGSPETLGIEVTSIVDTILLLKNVEVHNKIEKGIFVLKIRGRKHKSEIRSVITSKGGLEIKKLGWHMEGLLSGTVGQIHEPEVFIKLFYENEAESGINMPGAEEFEKRYPTGRVKVTTVRKPEIHIDVWSFREERGPSHSNVKIVSVKQYWAIGFLEGERLYPLADYMPEEMKNEKKDDMFWKECLAASKTDGKNDTLNSIHLIPYYTDIYTLTYRKDILKDIYKMNVDLLKIAAKHKIKIRNDLLTLDNLIDLIKHVEIDFEKKRKKKLLNKEIQYYFAMPDLFDKSSFMTFFLEVLWAHGGNIFKIPDDLQFKDYEKNLFSWEDICENSELLKEFLIDNFNLNWVKNATIVKNNELKIKYIKMSAEKESLSFKLNDEKTKVELYIENDKKDEFPVKNENNKPNIYTKRIKKEYATPYDLRMYIFENLDDALVINKDEAKKALEKLKQWVDKEYSPNPFLGDFSEKALFSMQWYSKIKRNKKSKKLDRIGVAPPPAGPGSDKGHLTYDLCCLALIKGAIAPEMGWLFIDTLASGKNMEEMAKGKSGLPGAEKAYYDEDFIGFDNEANRIVKDFILEKKGIYELKTLSRIPYYYKIESMIHNEITNVFNPNKDKNIEVEKALNNAYDKIYNFLLDKKQNEK